MVIVVDIHNKDALEREFGRIRRLFDDLKEEEILRLEWGTKQTFEELEVNK